MSSVFEVAPAIRGIDTRMGGRRKVTSSYLVEAREPALVETGPTTSKGVLLEGLEELGVGPDDLAHIVVTHIHLDHAGGAGSLAPHFPRATVWVHQAGAPHLADPTRLVASATRVYGSSTLEEVFGPVEPVPADRLRSLSDGDRVDLGDRHLEALHTPGHAGHHVCLVDSRTGDVFVGDAFGVFLPDVGVLRPATPPPEFDLELAVSSIERVAARRPKVLLFSHFGPAGDPASLARLAVERLRRWASVVEDAARESDDLERITALLRAGTAAEVERVSASDEDRYELLSSYRMNAMGLMRYVRKREESRG